MMTSTYHSHGPQPIGQSHFFYYNPAPTQDNHQNSHFLPDPNGSAMAQPPSRVVPSHGAHVYPGSMFSEPQSLGSPIAYPARSIYYADSRLTPTVSPRPTYQKPAGLGQSHQHSQYLLPLDTSCVDLSYAPSTPPLSSSSGSASSSPPLSCEILPTPVNGLYSAHQGGFDILVKESEEAAIFDVLAANDWVNSASPPPTPEDSLSLRQGKSSNGQTQGHGLLSAASCPSLSPSPASTRSGCHQSAVCDPRTLTVSSSALASSIPCLPTLCPGDDEHRELLSGEPSTAEPRSDPAASDAGDFFGVHGLSTFEPLFELESEEDFASAVAPVQMPSTENALFLGGKRQRIGGSAIHEEDGLYFEESLSDFEEESPSSRPVTPTFGRSPPQPDACISVLAETFVAGTSSYLEPCLTLALPEQSRQEAESPSTSDERTYMSPNRASSESASGSGPDDDAAMPSKTKVARRGRKQSLTEDPLKTFVCTLCSRRFRRQEHLKRHYRSLHTHEKPFECVDCGKKFSRSDNLTQHQKTHRSETIVMGVLNDVELQKQREIYGGVGDSSALGAVFYDSAMNVSPSVAECGPGYDADAMWEKRGKKRRRNE